MVTITYCGSDGPLENNGIFYLSFDREQAIEGAWIAHFYNRYPVVKHTSTPEGVTLYLSDLSVINYGQLVKEHIHLYNDEYGVKSEEHVPFKDWAVPRKLKFKVATA